MAEDIPYRIISRAWLGNFVGRRRHHLNTPHEQMLFGREFFSCTKCLAFLASVKEKILFPRASEINKNK
jgi:hypothetical protein